MEEFKTYTLAFPMRNVTIRIPEGVASHRGELSELIRRGRVIRADVLRDSWSDSWTPQYVNLSLVERVL